MTAFFETVTPFFLTLLERSVLATFFVIFLALLTHYGRRHISPRVRFGLWLLVPVQLLMVVTIPSNAGVANFFVIDAQKSVAMTTPIENKTVTEPFFTDTPFMESEGNGIAFFEEST